MARSRLISPKLFVDEALGQLSPTHRLLFADLWTIADRLGRAKDSPRSIHVQLLPWDVCDVDQLLSDLAAIDVIVRYEVDGKRYLAVRNFLKYQKPHRRETTSEIPDPPVLGPTKVRPRRTKDRTSPAVSVTDPISVSVSIHTTAAAAPPACAPKDLQNLWNELRGSLQEWVELPDNWLPRIKARLRERPIDGDRGWRDVITRIAASDFCHGHGDKHWVATPAFLLQPDAATKVLSGLYDNRVAKPKPRPSDVNAAYQLPIPETIDEAEARLRKRYGMEAS